MEHPEHRQAWDPLFDPDDEAPALSVAAEDKPEAVTRRAPPVRCYEIAALRPDGSIFVGQEVSQANPLLDSAFSAFDGGALITTAIGATPVADLQPGDQISTMSGRMRTLLWVGSSTFVPADAGGRFTQMRIMPSVFGAGRPAVPITTGPGARFVFGPEHGLSKALGKPTRLPVQHIAARERIVEVTPRTPTRLFHLCLDRPDVLDVQGIPIESFRPDEALLDGLPAPRLTQFRAVFAAPALFQNFGSAPHPANATAEPRGSRAQTRRS